MRRTASEVIRSLEMRVAKLESGSWLELDFKLNKLNLRGELKMKGLLEFLISGLNKEIGDPMLVERVQYALFRPIRTIVAHFQKGLGHEPNIKRMTIEKKKGSSEVTLNMSLHLKLFVNDDPNFMSVSVEEGQLNNKDISDAFSPYFPRRRQLPLSELFTKAVSVSYDPIKRQITSDTPILIKSSLSSKLSKEIELFKADRESEETLVRDWIRDWGNSYLQEANKMILDNDFDTDSFKKPFRRLALAIYDALDEYIDQRMPYGDDEYWYSSGSEKGTRDYLLEDMDVKKSSVLVDSKVLGLEDDPQRPLFVFLIDIEGRFEDAGEVGEHDATLVVLDFVSGKYDIKYGSLTKMTGLYKSMS